MERARHAGPSGGGAVDAAPAAPRRAIPVPAGANGAPGQGWGRIARRIAAPLAMLSVAGLAASVLLPPASDDPFVLTDPQHAAMSTVSPSTADAGTSRDETRPSLLDDAGVPTVSIAPQVSVSPSAVASASGGASASDTPSASTLPASTSSAARPSATESAQTAGTAKASPTPTPTAAAVDYAAIADPAGTLYASASVNVRRGPGTGYDVRTSLAEGAEVATTSWTVDGWRQVVVADEAGWIKGTYLTEDVPESSGAVTSTTCAAGASIESGLTARTVEVLRDVCAAFPEVDSYGGYRADGDSYHGSGRAIDVMVSGNAGWEIARWVRANASTLGVVEVIYAQKIWTTERADEGWRWMSDRGSATANHYDHVHISVA